MSISEQQQDSIDRFLHNELAGAELELFLLEVEKDSSLKKELKAQQEIMEGIEFHGNKNLRQRFSKISEEVKQDRKSNPKSNQKIIRFVLSSAAAIVLLLLAFNFFFKKPDIKQVLAQFDQTYEFSNIRSGKIAKETATANQLYNDQNYAQAIPILKSILESHPENSNIQLAYGSALSKTGQNDLAILQYQSIINRKDSLYLDQAKWFLALDYLKIKNQKAAKTILLDLKNEPSADFHKEATKLLDLLPE